MLNKILITCLLFSAASAQAALKIQSWSQPDGSKVLFVESRSVPIVDVRIEFDAGARRDPEAKAGLAALTNALLAGGIRAQGSEPALSEAQVSDAFADIGAQRADEASDDRAGISLRTLSSTAERDAGIALLARLVAHPAFPAAQFARDQARVVAAIKEELTRPEALAQRALSRLMYGSHPYAKNETPASIAAITVDDVRQFHAGHYVANRALVAIIGDLDRPQAEAIARRLTAQLAQGQALPALPEPPPARAAEERIAHPASQSQIVIGAPAVARGDADHFALTVGNYILGGGGFVSRLMNEVREKRGLVYGVDSGFQPMAQKGPFEITLQTSREQTDAALDVVRKTLADFLKNGPSANELKAAKDNLIGGFALRIDNNRKILDNIAAIGFYGLPLDYLDTWSAKVNAVTLADIRAAFQRKVSADRLATVVVGAAP